jgi:hypothetical protein
MDSSSAPLRSAGGNEGPGADDESFPDTTDFGIRNGDLIDLALLDRYHINISPRTAGAQLFLANFCNQAENSKCRQYHYSLLYARQPDPGLADVAVVNASGLEDTAFLYCA